MTPTQERNYWKERIKKALELLPRNWVETFMFTYPEYKDQASRINNVKFHMIADKEIIKLMEELAEKLKPSKVA